MITDVQVGLVGKLADRVAKESFIVVLLVLLLGAVGWFSYSLNEKLYNLMQENIKVIERNSFVIETSQRELLKSVERDHAEIKEALKELRQKIR